MQINDKETKALCDAVKAVIDENAKDYKPNRGGKGHDDFIDLHTINVEEGNEFTTAAAKAAVAGDKEFEFDGKTYPSEMDIEVAKKILGESTTSESQIEEAVRPNDKVFVKGKNRDGKPVNYFAFGGSYKEDKAFRSAIKKLLSNSVKKKFDVYVDGNSDLVDSDSSKTIISFNDKMTVADVAKAVDEFIKKEYGIKESIDLEEAFIDVDTVDPKSPEFAKLVRKYKVKGKILTMKGPGGMPLVKLTGKRKDLEAILKDPMGWQDDGFLAGYIEESIDLEEATMSQGVKTAQTQIYSLEKSLKVGSNLNKGVNKSLEGKYDADFKKMQKAIDQIISVWEEIERDFAMNESSEVLGEANIKYGIIRYPDTAISYVKNDGKGWEHIYDKSYGFKGKVDSSDLKHMSPIDKSKIPGRLTKESSENELLVKDLEMLIKNPDPARVKQYGGKDKYVKMLKAKLAKLQEMFTEESKDFKPHWMYDPETGEKEWAEVEADHIRLSKLGWGHKPTNESKEVNENVANVIKKVEKLKLKVGDKTNFGEVKDISDKSITFKAKDTPKTEILFKTRKFGSRDYVLDQLVKLTSDGKRLAKESAELEEAINFSKVPDNQLIKWLQQFTGKNKKNADHAQLWKGFKKDLVAAEKEAKKRGLIIESTDLEEAKIPSSNISKFSDPKLAKSAASKQKYKTQVFMGDDGEFWVPSTNKEAGQLKKDGYEVYESADLDEGLKAGRGKITVDLGWDLDGADADAAERKYKIKLKITPAKLAGHADTVSITGDKKNVLAYVQSGDYGVDISGRPSSKGLSDGDIKDMFPKILETYDNLAEATESDLKKVLAAAKKAGGRVKGNTADFGMGASIEFSIEKGKIKFDGGRATGVGYFDNVDDALASLAAGLG